MVGINTGASSRSAGWTARISAPSWCASKILDALSAPFHLGGQEVYAPASIGIALFPDDGSDPAELLKNADLALYRAKNQGRFRFRLFEPAMDAEVQARKLLELELRRAIEREELVLEYQPQLDLSNGRFAGVEALVRWRHPRRGLVMPGEFIPVAEASGLIRALRVPSASRARTL